MPDQTSTSHAAYSVGERIEFKAILPRGLTIGPEGDSMDQSFVTEHWQKGHIVAHEDVLYEVKDESGLVRNVPDYKIRRLRLNDQ